MTQLDIDFARSQGEDLADKCAAKAQSQGWDKEGAKKYVVGYLRRYGDTSGEVLVEQAVEHGYRPHDTRAFGPVFKALSGAGLIKTVGFALRAHGNGTAGARIWRSVD